MTPASGEQAGIINNPEHLRALATQMREEAKRAEAHAEKLQSGPPMATPLTSSGCWNILGTCIMFPPL